MIFLCQSSTFSRSITLLLFTGCLCPIRGCRSHLRFLAAGRDIERKAGQGLCAAQPYYFREIPRDSPTMRSALSMQPQKPLPRRSGDTKKVGGDELGVSLRQLGNQRQIY